jgi:hypothetical protein
LILYSKTNYHKYSTRNICRKVDMLVELHSRLFCREFGFGYADRHSAEMRKSIAYKNPVRPGKVRRSERAGYGLDGL